MVGGVRVDRIATENVVSGVESDKVHPSARGSGHVAGVAGWSLRGTAYRAFRAPTLNERFRNFRVGDSLTLANEELVAEELTGGEISALLAVIAGRGARGRRSSTRRSTTPSPTSR